MSRAPFLSAIIMPVIVATALAWRDTGSVKWLSFALVMASLVAAHAGANLLNDYFDWRLGADRINPNRNRLSGGSPHIAEGRAEPSLFLRSGIASFIAAAAAGVALLLTCGRPLLPLLLIGLAGFAAGVLYTAPPFKLAYRGWGEACIFAAFGVLPAAGVYYLQAGTVTAAAVGASLPLAFLVTGIILVNEFPDCESDREAGKRQLVARMGTGRARYLYLAAAAAAFASVVWTAACSGFGGWTALALLALPLSLAAAIILFRNHSEPAALLPAQSLTVAAHAAAGLLLTVGLLLG
jgi:1,4-dihydroxy-2-naphthoate octaprenyltransferase